jgi:predicted MFS family arabinose efflux permease
VTAAVLAEPVAGHRALPSGRYQVLLVTLLSINFGIVFFDRNALGFLMGSVQPELGLSETRVGLLASGLSLTWSLAAFGMGAFSDAIGNRRIPLILTTLAFCACSFVTGLAHSFLLLLAARMLMGVAEGGVMPISHAMIVTEVDPKHRGIAQGVAQNFGSNFLGSVIAPTVLVAFATAYGWRNAFFLAAVPGLVTALLIWVLLREPPRPPVRPVAEARKESWLNVLGERNVLICCVLAVLLVSYLVVCLTFLPKYLLNVRHYDPGTMSLLIATLGVSATIGSFAISGLSDRVGRRPVMIAMPLIGVILPLGAMYFDGSVWLLAAIFFAGWGLVGIFPLFMATVPSESVSPTRVATALGLCMGTGEVLGGVLSPALAGMAADRWGPNMPFWIMVGLTLAAGFVAMLLVETAPRRRRTAPLSADQADPRD